jgi:hypothetical protein
MISVGRKKKWVIKYCDRKMILSSTLFSMRDKFSKIVVDELKILVALILYDTHTQRIMRKLVALILYDAHTQMIMRKMIKVYHPEKHQKG